MPWPPYLCFLNARYSLYACAATHGDFRRDENRVWICTGNITEYGRAIETAMAAIGAAYFVGLVEYYDASLCLLASIMKNASARTFDSKHCQCPEEANPTHVTTEHGSYTVSTGH